MAPADDLSVVPPSPTYPTETYQNYKVFPDDVEQTIDQILSEEADLEVSRSKHWPFDSGADQSRYSPASGLLQNGDSERVPTELSPPGEMMKSTAKKIKKSTKPKKEKKKKKKRTAAKREITFIDLVTDDEDNEPEHLDVDHDKHDEDDGPREMNGNDSHQTVKDREEDAFIFSSVSHSVKRRIMRFILRHPFMSQFVQPVQRSARRQFTTELVAKAQSAGLDFSMIWSLIKYVRVLYLESAGVKPEPLEASLVDIPFGEEVHDDEIPSGQDNHEDAAPTPHSQKHRKRSRDEGSSVDLKTKKRKKKHLLDQDRVQPASDPEVIEIADDETSPVPPELPDAPRDSEDEQNAVVRDQTAPESFPDPVVSDDEVQNEIAEPSLVESTHDVPSHLEVNSIEETTSAHDVDGALEGAQEVSDSAWAGEQSNEEGIPESEHEKEMSPQAETVELRKEYNPVIALGLTQGPLIELSNSQKRNARRKLLKKALKESKMDKAEDDPQPALSLQTAVTVTDVIEENLFPDLPFEPCIKSSTKLSKNQKRQERRRAKREQKAKKRQAREERSQKTEQQPSSLWLKHHRQLSFQDTSVQATQAKDWRVPVPLSKPRVRNPEPRKERKRREREHRREQKRARRQKRESLKFALESDVTDSDHDQEDQLPTETPKVDKHELERQGEKEQRQEQKRQEQSLAMDQNKDDLDDDLDEGVELSNGSSEPRKIANDGEENEISPSNDVPNAQVDDPRDTPQPEITVEKNSAAVSTPKPDGPVNKTSAWEPMSTPQRKNPTAVPMPTSTPTSQSTSSSRSRYGPLSPDPKEWDSDF